MAVPPAKTPDGGTQVQTQADYSVSVVKPYNYDSAGNNIAAASHILR